MSEWVKVTTVDEVKPGTVVQVEVEGEPVCLANTGEEFLATSDICSHDYVELHDGWLEEDEIECPQHGSRFNMRTGKVLNPPATQSIAPYETKVEGQDVYVRGPMERVK
ncbi:MAG TPA: non-heme iron oxygenase ferredoxin subunit [Actinomycetota bacterium]|jgi:3-phenylpropionate/trans-cinnamate dioxygenase ferredoxin subunit|nr:non-heme iron oxygenase ferredoxin subunit [Actinomycetota bacterium]